METGLIITNMISNGSVSNLEILNGGLEFRTDNYYIKYKGLNKFSEDHLFIEDKRYFVVLDGVILNKKELLSDSSTNSWKECFCELIKDGIETGINQLRGSFRGAVIDFDSDKIKIFTNQTGEKTIYYFIQEGKFIAASHAVILIKAMKCLGLSYSPDISALHELLCIGEILSDKSPIQEIKRLTAGKMLEINKKNIEIHSYHRFKNYPEFTGDIDECIDLLDTKYRDAIERIFSKNLEYGYISECDLSGGLDSRMVAWVANDLGFKNIINISYCQSKSIDHKVSKKLASDLGNEYIFIPLDGGSFLMEIEDTCRKFGGQETYTICTGAVQAIEKIKDKNVGIMAMGLWGEALKAELWGGETHMPGNVTTRYSNIIPFQFPENISAQYETYEQEGFYEYGAPLIISSIIARQDFTEAFSPNMDVDLLEFIYSIPLEYRRNYRIFEKWMISKYPKAAEYLWSTVKMPVNYHYNNKVYIPKLLHSLSDFGKRIINKLSREIDIHLQIPLYHEMHPIQVWYMTNDTLREFINNYYQNYSKIITDKSLKNEISETFVSKIAWNKIQAINVIATYKLFFCD